MRKLFSRVLCVGLLGAALAAAAVSGAVAESRLGVAGRATEGLDIIGRTTEYGASLRETKTISEFMATRSFSEAPELIRDFAAASLPLAREFRAKLNTTTLDANGTEEAVAKMLTGIAGDPASEDIADDMKLKSIFALQTVFHCTMFGVEYGRFTALRRGVTEDEAVDGMVTDYASATLDGLIAYLAELPQPEVPAPQPEVSAPQPEAPSETP